MCVMKICKEIIVLNIQSLPCIKFKLKTKYLKYSKILNVYKLFKTRRILKYLSRKL